MKKIESIHGLVGLGLILGIGLMACSQDSPCLGLECAQNGFCCQDEICCYGDESCQGDSCCGTGRDGVPVTYTEESDFTDLFWIGTLGIEEQHRFSGDDPGHDTLVQANFFDMTDYSVFIPDPLVFSEACIMITGKPSMEGEKVPLRASWVRFEGLAGGTLQLEPNVDGVFPPKLLPKRAFEAQRISLKVSSEEGETDYPSFEDELASPVFVEEVRLDGSLVDFSTSPRIGIGLDRTENLKVRWKPGGGDYMEIKIAPKAGSVTDYVRLRCITFDDGCFEIPVEAIKHLALDTATNFEFRLERHQRKTRVLEQHNAPKAVLVLDASAELSGLVLR